ncbi:cytochrome c family protein [Alphaproteobacteria bacterium KMM 3653]|uniref:Cytochrome c family protein n=1 Tax=Harenicola maris TaxID=2841044 RepID=A0AAP2CRG8_9RHOB|nr:cytochrome c family protein [Harenicola maris]
MFDTMTMVKSFGWLCGAFLAFLLIKWVAEETYHIGGSGHGDHHEQAYSIDTGADDSGAAVEEEVIDIAALMAEADVSKGEKGFSKCKACHKLEAGENGTGPSLFGVVGRPVDAIDGFNYSGALEEVASEWTVENLFHFLENPKKFAPGTAMAFAGLRKPGDRADLIAYLSTFSQ